MKKIVCGYSSFLEILDPKEYIIIEKDNQRISDKYVDLDGKKFNEYEDCRVLKKGDVIIREFYRISFWIWNEGIFVYFGKFKCYDRYSVSNERTLELKQGMRMKNSAFDFYYVKDKIVDLFSRDMKIKIS